MRRIAFFFIGADRAGMLSAVRRGELPDSGLRGANFFADREGYAVDLISTHTFETRLPGFVRRLVPIFLLQLAFIPRLFRYDVVIASDAPLLGCLLSLFGLKWIFIAINTSALIKRHSAHPLRAHLLRFCWNRYAAVICLSKKQKADLARFGVREILLAYIPFGVDTEYFSENRSEGSTIVSIGKDMGRDYATLLQAAEQTGLPVEIIASRKNIPMSAKIPANVRIRFNVPLTEMREVYARARFLVVPSLPDGTVLGTDCSGQTVILEALAAGRAVVATRRAWLAEYLSEAEDFIEAPAGDATALAVAMRRLSRDEALRRRRAARGARTVREKYSSKRFANDLMELVEHVIA